MTFKEEEKIILKYKLDHIGSLGPISSGSLPVKLRTLLSLVNSVFNAHAE